MTFYPARYAKTYQTWHENIRDWCISRQLWWGHRIPVWSNAGGLEAGYKKTFGSAADGLRINEHIENIRVLEAAGRIATMDGFNFICLRDGDDEEVKKELEDWGWSEDPDVLDTWFSSALWPMSTLGWPVADQSATPQGRDAGGFALSKWNPTSVLTTAREIITLWVSRMVMFNEFFLGQIPFKDVFIHAMIQDGEGRKMSKSLGNGVDPLDIISSHGTDAMRFTLTSMCTQTQDVRMPVEKDPTTGKNTSPKFDIGRNFANKVWNAARFVLMQIGESASRQVGDYALTLADQWILSRLNRTIDDVNAAIAEYRFDQYAKSCYDFFWGDFCDWYVEAAKPQMKDPARAASTARVLASVLDASLRLMHPMIPFVTEKIWWNLNEIYPDRGLTGRVACPTAPRIIKAQWPLRNEFAEPTEEVFSNIQAIVVAIRNLRSDYKVDAKKSVAVSIKSSGDAAQGILSLKASIETLASCVLTAVGPEVDEPANSAKAQAGGCELFVEGLIDPEAEKLRNAKRRDELAKNVAALKGRLGNAGYLAKAPANLVKQTQDQLAEAEAELASLG